MNQSTETAHRPLSDIARDIRQHWKKVSPHAEPYLSAMEELNSIRDMLYADTAKSVVLYFLSKATGWRGEHARATKAELKAIIKSTGYNI